MLGALGGGGGALLSMILFLFRDQCEPLLRVVLPLLTARLLGSSFHYRPEQYYWIAGYVGLLAVLWSVAVGLAIIRKPAQDRRVDAALRQQSRGQVARGAPLEPK